MLKNKWFISFLFILVFSVFLYINLENYTLENTNSTDLSTVSNAEMEKVIKLNPNIFPMRMALANRYFESFEYSDALIHYMYIAQNSNESETKSIALAQIGWMVFESGDVNTSLNYINQSLRIIPNSILAKSYKGIILIQQDETRIEGINLLKSIVSNNSLPIEDLELINQVLQFYEN